MLRTIAAAVVASLVVTATIARAEEPTRVSEACKTEIASLCQADAKPDGKGRGYRSCLEQNESKLGAACAGAIRTAREQREKVRTACEADRAKHCNDAGQKAGAAMQCLRAKQAELTKPCADALAALPQRTARQ